MKKKILALVLASMASVSIMAFSANADMPCNTDMLCDADMPGNAVMPCAAECGNCGNFTLHTVLLGTHLEQPTKVNCIHGTSGYDTRYMQINTYQTSCTSCAYYSSFRTNAGHRYICNGD